VPTRHSSTLVPSMPGPLDLRCRSPWPPTGTSDPPRKTPRNTQGVRQIGLAGSISYPTPAHGRRPTLRLRCALPGRLSKGLLRCIDLPEVGRGWSSRSTPTGPPSKQTVANFKEIFPRPPEKASAPAGLAHFPCLRAHSPALRQLGARGVHPRPKEYEEVLNWVLQTSGKNPRAMPNLKGATCAPPTTIFTGSMRPAGQRPKAGRRPPRISFGMDAP